VPQTIVFVQGIVDFLDHATNLIFVRRIGGG
jgi:hypothetical protein